MDIKNILKNLKLHESTISMVLGFLVIVVVGLVVVNYFRTLDTGETFPDGATAEQEAENQDETYTVAAGDTLWSISEEFYGTGFNWVDIRDANELSDGNIEVGQELTIPDTGARDDGQDSELAMATAEPTIEPTPEPTVEPTPEATGTDTEETEETIEETDEVSPIIGDNYTVVRGDNLWDIAVRAYGDGYRWTDIAEANDLLNPGIIHAGNVLVLPR